MLALVTNDDGVGSVGIRVLARSALAAGLDVLVAAPARDMSGASAALTSVEKDGRFLIDEVAWDDARQAPGRIVSVEAAPAFIVRAAFSGAFGASPDLVLSGVNHGFNTGHAVLHSGTVGAALTASTHKAPSLAVSTDAGTEIHWDTVTQVIGMALAWMIDTALPVVLNVNVPNIAPADLRGLRRARLAAFGAVQATVVEAGTDPAEGPAPATGRPSPAAAGGGASKPARGFRKLAYHQVDGELEPGTDAALLADGFACFTPLQAVCEAGGVDTAPWALRPGGEAPMDRGQPWPAQRGLDGPANRSTASERLEP